MKNHRSIPTALQIVAVLFLLGGIGSVIGMVIHLFSDSLHIDFGFLGIPTYFGLRRLSVGWRTFALVWIWFALAICLIAFVIGLLGESPAFVQFYGIRLASVDPIWLSVVSVPMFLLEVWQLRVLTEAKVRELFFPDPDAPKAG